MEESSSNIPDPEIIPDSTIENVPSLPVDENEATVESNPEVINPSTAVTVPSEPRISTRRSRQSLGAETEKEPRRQSKASDDNGSRHSVNSDGEKETKKTSKVQDGKTCSKPQWQIGSRLEAKDFLKKWYPARIVDIDVKDNTALVHFEGWNQRYDEWMDIGGSRLRPLTRQSERHKEGGKVKAVHKVNECVMARWTDNRMYAGRIKAINPDGTYDIKFFDGLQKSLPAIRVRTMSLDQRQMLESGNGQVPGPSTSSQQSSPVSAEKIRRISGPIEESQQTQDQIVKSAVKTERSRSNSSVNYMKRCSVRVRRCLSSPTDVRSSPSFRRKRHADLTKVEEVEATKHEDSAGDVVNSPCKKRARLSGTNRGRLASSQSSVSTQLTSPVLKDEQDTAPFPVVSSKLFDEPHQVKCPRPGCTKYFRNSTLLDYHLKYYHVDDKSKAAVPNEKRSKTISICSTDSEISIGDRSPCASLSTPNFRIVSSLAAPSLDTSVSVGNIPSSENKEKDFRHVREKRKMELREEMLNRKVINCRCRVNKEIPPMAQCSVCLCWQHSRCIQPSGLESNFRKYVCSVCINPPGVRENARFSYDQSWLRDGCMAKFSMVPDEPNSSGMAKIMKATHELVADVHGVKQVLESVDREILVLKHKKDPEFSLWKRKIDVVIPKSESNFDPETLCPQTASQNNELVAADESGGAEKKLKEESTASASFAVTESSGLSNGSANGLHPLSDALVDSSCMNGNEPAELSSSKASDTNHKSVDEIEDGAPSEDNLRNDEVDLANDSGLQAAENCDLPGTNENHHQENSVDDEKKDEMEELCRTNLLDHIRRMQDGIETRLDLVEEQVAALEHGEGNRSSSSNGEVVRDLPRVKKTLHQLINDLGKVHRMSMYH